MKVLLAVFAVPLMLTLFLAPPMAFAEDCEIVIVTSPADNPKLRCEVFGGRTMLCFPI